MFVLDHAIAAWRHSLRFNHAFTPDDLDELESHLRDHVEALIAQGQAEEDAFDQALRRLGPHHEVAGEYRKVRWTRTKRRQTLRQAVAWYLVMGRAYLRTARRHLASNPSYTTVNVLGLALGIACCVLIALYVHGEYRVDRHVPAGDRLYRVVEHRAVPDGPDELIAYTMGPLGPVLAEQLPEVERATRLVTDYGTGRFTVTRGPNRFYEHEHLFVEPSFLEVFGLSLQRGDAATALARPGTVVLTPAAARRYFGEADPLGQTLQTEWLGDVTVTGIVARPVDTHLQFSMLISYATLTQLDNWRAYLDDWRSTNVLTYLKLARGAAPDRVQGALDDLLQKHRAPSDLAARRPVLQPLHAVHFGSRAILHERNDQEGDATTLTIFSTAALFVLLIAGINYMNMATAQT